jgi:phosphonate transport system ATP-binding protein
MDAGPTCADRSAEGVVPLLRVSGATLAPRPDAPVVLEGVEFTVRAGECVALVGPSGAGKTTLLRALCGQVRPRAGRIIFDGLELSAFGGAALRGVRSQIALIAQKHDLVEPLKVHRNVMAGALGRWSELRALRYLFWTRPDELAEAEHALQAVGLAAKLKSATSALSGGEQQRVAIARALIQAPRMLLADEPVASLDPGVAVDVLELLTRLCRERGMAVVCSLHQPDLATRFFGRVLEVRDGCVGETPREPSELAALAQFA